MSSGFFLLSSVLVIVLPGPDAALILRTVLRYGRRGPALAAAAGMILAGAGHVGLSVSGMALMLRTEPALLQTVRLIGAAALFAWGVWALWESIRPATAVPAAGSAATSRWSLLLGFLSTATNPKVSLFLIAFLPQFVPPGAAPVPALVTLAAVYLIIGALWLVLLTELVHRMRQRLFTPGLVRMLQRATGLLFMAFAARLAMQ